MKTTTQNIVGQSKSGMRMSGYGDTFQCRRVIFIKCVITSTIITTMNQNRKLEPARTITLLLKLTNNSLGLNEGNHDHGGVWISVLN